jgi:hypothetical protein
VKGETRGATYQVLACSYFFFAVHFLEFCSIVLYLQYLAVICSILQYFAPFFCGILQQFVLFCNILQYFLEKNAVVNSTF